MEAQGPVAVGGVTWGGWAVCTGGGFSVAQTCRARWLGRVAGSWASVEEAVFREGVGLPTPHSPPAAARTFPPPPRAAPQSSAAAALPESVAGPRRPAPRRTAVAEERPRALHPLRPQ